MLLHTETFSFGNQWQHNAQSVVVTRLYSSRIQCCSMVTTVFSTGQMKVTLWGHDCNHDSGRNTTSANCEVGDFGHVLAQCLWRSYLFSAWLTSIHLHSHYIVLLTYTKCRSRAPSLNSSAAKQQRFINTVTTKQDQRIPLMRKHCHQN